MRSRVLAAAVAAAAARVRETERLMRRTLRHRIAAHADWVKLTRQGCMHRCRRHVDTQSTDADGAGTEARAELVQRQEYLDTTNAKNIPNIFNLIGRRSKRL